MYSSKLKLIVLFAFVMGFVSFTSLPVSAHDNKQNQRPVFAQNYFNKYFKKHITAKKNKKNNHNKHHDHKPTKTPTPTVTPTATPTPTVLPTVSNVTLKECTSTSCTATSTVEVNGTGFTANARAKIVSGTTELSVENAKAQLVGGNGTTQIIMDFYGAPSGIYDLVVYSTTNEFAPVTKVAAVSL